VFSDLLPTWVFKLCADVLAPFLAFVSDRSFVTGSILANYKAAYITPLLKKPDLDPTNVQSYRPISQLSVVFKLQERLTAGRLLSYLTVNGSNAVAAISIPRLPFHGDRRASGAD
jgi:hypothetical protein